MSDLYIRPNDPTMPSGNTDVRNANKAAKTVAEDNAASEAMDSEKRINDAAEASKAKVEAEVDAKEVDAKKAFNTEEAIAKLEEFTQSIDRDLSFRVDESSGETVISVIDTKTDEVIREIPGEAALRLSEEIEQLRSLVFTARA